MNENNINNRVEPVEEESLGLQDIWNMFWPHWRWFLLSVVVCLAAGIYYIASTPPTYTRSATVLIKEVGRGRSMLGGAANEFSRMGILQTATSVYNELITFQSPTLMTDVVKKLGLTETYKTRSGLKTVQLYNTSPVLVTFMEKNDIPAKFDMEIVDGQSVRLSEFIVKGEESGETYTAKFGERVETSFGPLVLSAGRTMADTLAGKVIYFSKGSLAAVTDAYTARLGASLADKEATVIKLSISDESPKKAEDILNALIEAYNDFWVESKNQMTVSTSQFIDERLAVIEADLGNVDNSISAYKSKNLLPDLQEVSRLYMQQSAEYRKALLELNTQLLNAEYIRSVLDKKELDSTLPGISGISDQSLNSQLTAYNDLVMERNRLVANSSEKNPLVRDLDKSLGNMQVSIIQSIDNLIVSINNRIENITEQEDINTGRLASGPDQAKHLLTIERQQKIKESLYLFLLQKREENELSQAFTAYNSSVITAPRGSRLPIAPKKSMILMVALMMGLCIPGGIIFLRETTNTKIRGRKDLERLNVPLVGEIPRYVDPAKKWYNLKDKRGNMIVVTEGRRNIINEAFRVLRSNVSFMLGKNSSHKVIVMTSFNPASGKSFIATNLCYSFAIKQKKTLLIDGDLRHASTSASFGSPSKGLTGYLSGRTDDWRKRIVRVEPHSEYLHVLPVGAIPPNPTELLEGDRFRELIEQARAEYDYIFIDCPPVDIVADAQIIEQYADRTFFVVRAGLLERSMVPDINALYRKKRFKNLGIILNDTEGAGGRYASRYAYYAYASTYFGDKD